MWLCSWLKDRSTEIILPSVCWRVQNSSMRNVRIFRCNLETKCNCANETFTWMAKYKFDKVYANACIWMIFRDTTSTHELLVLFEKTDRYVILCSSQTNEKRNSTREKTPSKRKRRAFSPLSIDLRVARTFYSLIVSRFFVILVFFFVAGFSVVYDARRCCESVGSELSVCVYF